MNDKLFNPDYLKHLCQKFGLRPSRQYGQNFLIDSEVIEHIVEFANITSDDTVVEVGPGFGVLTLAMAPKVKQIVAFEIEKKLQPYWTEVQKKFPNVEIVWGNVLREWPVLSPTLSTAVERGTPSHSAADGAARHLPSAAADGVGGGLVRSRYKVVANLPYQITSAAIRTFLESDNYPLDSARGGPVGPPTEMILMVQKEVAERICAEPGAMSLLAMSVQYYSEPEFLFRVPRASFWPVPAVDSAVIKIKNIRRRGDAAATKYFFKVVQVGFANRRKLLIKNLEAIFGKKNRLILAEIFGTLGISLQARAQELSLKQWEKLVEWGLKFNPKI